MVMISILPECTCDCKFDMYTKSVDVQRFITLHSSYGWFLAHDIHRLRVQAWATAKSCRSSPRDASVHASSVHDKLSQGGEMAHGTARCRPLCMRGGCSLELILPQLQSSCNTILWGQN